MTRSMSVDGISTVTLRPPSIVLVTFWMRAWDEPSDVKSELACVMFPSSLRGLLVFLIIACGREVITRG